jgi:hypothetical protein
MQLGWANVAGATGYFIYEYINGKSTYLRRVGRDVTTTVVTGLQPGDTHFFNIVALLGDERPLAGWQSAQTENILPSSPAPLRASAVSSSEVLLEWNDSDSEDEYLVYEYVDGKSRFREHVGRDVTSHTISGLLPGSTHFFRVVATNELGTSETDWRRVDTPPQGVADVTGDGFVGFEDLTVLLAHWSQDVSVDQGNLVDAENTPVDFVDLGALLAEWSGPRPSGSGNVAATASNTASVLEQETQPIQRRRAVDVHFDRRGRQDAA